MTTFPAAEKSNFIDKKNLICSSCTGGDEAFRGSRQGRWWREGIKGQQQKSLPTRLASSLDTREGKMGQQTLDLVFSCCQFLYTALCLTLSQSKTMALYQTASRLAACSTESQELLFLCLLPGELPDLMLVEVNSLLTLCQHNSLNL